MIVKLLQQAGQWVTLRLSQWRQNRITDSTFMFLAAACIGLLAGAAAALLKWAINSVVEVMFRHFDISHGNWIFLLLPVVGIMLAMIYTRYVVRRPMDHASDCIAAGMAAGNNNMSPRMIFGSIIACTFTLGLGGSAGGEDPIACSGAAIGSNVGKAFRLQQDSLANLVGCGAAAGIAGIFMAPIGGVMFALEVLKMKQSLQTILAIILSSLTAALTCYILCGCHTDVTFVPSTRFDNSLIPWVLLCGLFCGLYSVYYSTMMRLCRGAFNRIANVWLKALTGGLLMSAMLFAFPSLYGEGYRIIGRLMVDDPLSTIAYGPLYRLGAGFPVLMALMFLLLLIKPLATSATNDSGGIGGDFTPTFFCGAIAGFLFAAVLNHYAGLHLPYALFAFFGMCGVMSGAIMAPLMAIFICAEMTGLYGFILPLTIISIASILTTLLVSRIHFKPLPFLHSLEAKVMHHPQPTNPPSDAENSAKND